MSKIGCRCGHVISDNTFIVPYKSYLLSDEETVKFFDWMCNEIQSYVLAVDDKKVTQWILDRGFGGGYANLNLDHGNVLHDHIHSRFVDIKKDVYRCEKCGRLLVETLNNIFTSYLPDERA